MYSYYGLSDALRARLDRLEESVGRPIWILPAVPSSVLRQAQSRVVLEAARQRDPSMTAERLADEAVIVAFAPTVACVSTTVYLGDGAYTASEPVEDPPFPIVVGEALVGYVEKNRVVCLVPDVVYLGDAPDVAAAWEALASAVETAVSPEIEESFATISRERARAALVTMVEQRGDVAVTRRRSDITEDEQSLVNLERRHRETLAALRVHRTELELLQAMAEQDTGERLVAEYDSVCAHPRVTAVTFEASTSTLSVTTDPIRLHHPDDPGETRYLGRFRLDVALDTMGVSIHNLENPRAGRDHPHVSGHDPCFGSHHAEFNELLAQGRLLVWLECVFQFLETYNPDDDWGRYAAYWFDAEDFDPDAPVPAAVLATNDHGPICEGDLVEFTDGAHLTGRAVAGSDDTPVAVVRDDGVEGGGPDGAWWINSYTLPSVRVLRHAAAA